MASTPIRNTFAARQRLADMLLLAAIVIPLAYWMITAQNGPDLVAVPDNSWYLNRAQRLLQGKLDGTFVYTMTFPVLVGVVELVVQEPQASAMIVNIAAVVLIVIG